MKYPFALFITTAVICLYTALGIDAANAAEKGFSRANTLLFLSDHLANIHQPTTLVYDFRKSGSLEESFRDTIEIKIVRVEKEGGKRVEVKYFTGDRHEFIPAISGASGNPVLRLFLDRDVHEMNRLAKGSWRYFLRSVKRAFADNAKVTPITFSYLQRQAKGTQIKISPYLQDPKRDEIGKYAGKRYEFTLSDDVPGSIYKIRTLIPDNKKGNPGKQAAPLIEEVLTFRRASP